MKRGLWGILSLALLFAGTQPAAAVKSDDSRIDIPYKKFVLDNGLRLIVHEDHKAPIVAVNIWYHVGSKNEKPGKSGFAHLFEHLMFNGSENFDDDYFQVLERVGATDLNGTTNTDRTNYFQNVPTSALDLALWMESDRMGHLLGAITQEKLDEQRGVVQNEKRQRENQPYAVAYELITKSTWPAGHPYSWTVIGSMDDLNAASLEDVHNWFKEYYGAANAVLVIAGDIDAETAKAKVEKYFGDIPSGPPVARHDVWIAKRSGSQRQIVEDRVPQARIYKVWNIPQTGSADADYLNLVSDVLGAGKNSRLYKRLVYDEQIATDVAAYVDLREIAGQFYLQATARPGGDLAAVEKALEEELARFLKEGPTEKELKRIKAQYKAGFVRGIERIGGFGGKSDILARNEVYHGDPGYYRTTLERIESATRDDLLRAARTWLSDGVYTLEVHPFPNYSTKPSDVDRSTLPETSEPPAAKFPKIEYATLSNGLKVVFARRTSVPVVNFDLLVDAGFSADVIPGTASLTMKMLDEGTKKRSALQISEELALLGARLRASSDLDVSAVYLSALKENLDESLDIYADVILNPSFPDKDFERLKKEQIAAIKREKVQPVSMALRVFPKLLYGEGHAYSTPGTGSGTEESVARLTRKDLIEFHKKWFKPNNATLVVVGATTLDEITSKLEKLFKKWHRGEVPGKNIATVEPPKQSKVYLIDKPGAKQSIIFAGTLTVPKNNPDELAIETMNNILGGMFTSRINMNLREDKHWAYGAFSLIFDARGQRPFLAYAPVQSDKTSESMAEIYREFKEYIGERPATEDELKKVKENRILRLPGYWETMGAVSSTLVEMVRFGLDESTIHTYAERLRALSLEDVHKVAKQVVTPDRLVWVVVGDRAMVEEKIRALGYGEIVHMDADGNILEP